MGIPSVIHVIGACTRTSLHCLAEGAPQKNEVKWLSLQKPPLGKFLSHEKVQVKSQNFSASSCLMTTFTAYLLAHSSERISHISARINDSYQWNEKIANSYGGISDEGN